METGTSSAVDKDQIDDDFVTVDFTARTLKTNRKTVYDAIARKEIPVVRVGRVFRVPGAWLRRAATMTEAGGGDVP
jgi:excisionase family DNA binding protein